MKSVVILGQSNYSWLWIPLAKKLKNESGAKIHFVASSPEGVAYWKKRDEEGVIDSFVTTNHFFSEYDNPEGSPESIYAEARGYEDKYKTFVVDVLQTDRHLGRGFSAAGTGHPRSELSDKADYLKSASIVNKAIKFWEDYFEKVKPDLLVGMAGGVIGKTCAIVARHRDIPIRALQPSGYQSFFYWRIDEYYSIPYIEKNYRAITDINGLVTGDEVRSLKRLPWSDENYKRLQQHTSRIFIFKQICGQIKRYLYKKVHHKVTMGNYKLPSVIKSVWRMHTGMRYMEKLDTVNIDKIKDLSYVFFPLHLEPESALGVRSPEFNEQMALIELLAKNLPAGNFLVVKEHIGAIGRRPVEFYQTLKDIPNVLIAHPCAYALDIARNARCVVVITSTLGTEAGISGIPVISVGIHNNYRFLPHVYTVESWKELRPLLARLCGADTEEAKRRRKEDGMRYLAALKAASIDLHWSDYSSAKRKPATARETEALYSSLIKSLSA
ncbi:MAG: hypothetical protein PHI59_01780 [Candidatus Omnitrophica bacterium]|nr:hypothetical protein [Candidatus Omnitrophota bacterium]